MRNIIHILSKFFDHVWIPITVVILIQTVERLKEFWINIFENYRKEFGGHACSLTRVSVPTELCCHSYFLFATEDWVMILLIVLQNCPFSLSLEDITRKIGAHTTIWCSFILNLALYLSVQTCYWPTSWRNSCDFKQLINAACETWRVGYFQRLSLNQKKLCSNRSSGTSYELLYLYAAYNTHTISPNFYRIQAFQTLESKVSRWSSTPNFSEIISPT